MVKSAAVAVAMLLTATNVSAANTAKVYNIRPGIKVALAETKCLLPYLPNAKQGKAAVVQNEQGNFVKGCWHEVVYNGKPFYHIEWANPKSQGDFAELEPHLFKDEEVQ